MKAYECMMIVDSKAKEEDVEKLVNKIDKTIKKHGGGEIKEVKKIGLKKLAYPIDHKNEGVYYLLNLEIDSVSIKEYESIMKLSNIVLRFLTQKSTSPSLKPEASCKREGKEKKIKEENSGEL